MFLFMCRDHVIKLGWSRELSDVGNWRRKISRSNIALRRSSWVRTQSSLSECKLCSNIALSNWRTRALSVCSADQVSAVFIHKDDNERDIWKLYFIHKSIDFISSSSSLSVKLHVLPRFSIFLKYNHCRRKQMFKYYSYQHI